MTNLHIPSAVRTNLRKLAGLNPHDARPVVVTEGDGAPREAGESYHWTTPSGKTRVRYPNAYGWPVLYHGSTRRVEVGLQWLVSYLAAQRIERERAAA